MKSSNIPFPEGRQLPSTGRWRKILTFNKYWITLLISENGCILITELKQCFLNLNELLTLWKFDNFWTFQISFRIWKFLPPLNRCLRDIGWLIWISVYIVLKTMFVHFAEYVTVMGWLVFPSSQICMLKTSLPSVSKCLEIGLLWR